MRRERVLSLLGYDPVLLRELSAEQRNSLRQGGMVWLSACLVLGLAAAYAAWSVHPAISAALAGGALGTLLTINLLRVVTAGGGAAIGDSLPQGEAACSRYRPSNIPALVFGVLAVILAQPAQLPLWPEIEPQVAAHRQNLIEHNAASTLLGTGARHHREELEAAGFPIFRLKLIWQNPRHALRLTAIMFLLVLLPAFWSQVISIRSLRAYELARCRRTHRARQQLDRECSARVTELLGRWPSFDPQNNWPGDAGPADKTPWMTRSPS